MTIAFLSLGSNIDKEKNIRAAVNVLSQAFAILSISPVYESEAVGFSGENFLNLIVEVETELPLLRFSEKLKKVERDLGREHASERFSSRTMDIDIVLFGELEGRHDGIELPRPELYLNAFVLRPMADIAPELTDPKTGHNMRFLLSKLASDQVLWQIPFSFDNALNSESTGL